ncbi:MAG: TlpA family protein disulfide reductase [Acidobacteria bacterium]|nr:TlpA family protein disulfide reductase [Acidobacteriota bacterium]
MKKVLFLTSLLLCLTPHAPAQTAATVEAAKFLPEEVLGRELRDLSGHTFRLSDFRGRVYVVNLWASWCGPCRVEIPGFIKIYDDYRGRGVEFVGLTAEDPEERAEEVRAFVGEAGMSYRVGWIDKPTVLTLANWNTTAPRPGGFAIPQTFVVGADGHVVLRVRGYNPRVHEMIRAGIRKALELAPPSAPAAPSAAPATGRP